MAILITFVNLLPYIILVLAVVAILIFYLFYEKKRTEPQVDDQYFIEIIESLGQIDNIVNTSIEHRRVQVELKAIEKVNTNQLKSLGISAFLTGKKITLLMNEQGDHLLEHIKSKRKEER